MGSGTLASLLLAAVTGAGAELEIRHEAGSCAVAEAFPVIAAVIAPGDRVARARVAFSSEPGKGDPPAGFWGVAMSREGDRFRAVLPRPRLSAGRIRYRIEAVDASAAVSRGPEQVLEVVADSSACAGAVVETTGTAKVVVEVPAGAPAVPPVPQGFSAVGAEAAEGAVQVGRKRGHKGLILGIAGVAAGGIAAAQLAGGEGGGAPTPADPQLAITLKTTSPPSGSTISISHEEFVLVLGIVVPQSPPVVTVRARLYNALVPARTCGALSQTFPAPASPSYDVLLRGFDSVAACGAVNRVEVRVEDDGGRLIVGTGSPGRPDFMVSYVFAP